MTRSKTGSVSSASTTATSCTMAGSSSPRLTRKLASGYCPRMIAASSSIADRTPGSRWSMVSRAEAGQVRPDQARLAAFLQQERVVAVVRAQVPVDDILASRLQGRRDPRRLVRRVQPVRAKAQHQIACPGPRKRPRQIVTAERQPEIE